MEYPPWKKELIKQKAIKQIEMLEEEIRKDIETIIEDFCNIIEDQKEEQKQHAVVIICSHLIAGFDKEEERIGTTKLIEETIKNIEQQEYEREEDEEDPQDIGFKDAFK